MTEGFRQGLRDLGYVEGRNVVIEIRDADGKLERLPDLAAELVALKVDVIVVGGTSGALAAKRATRAVPVIFVSAKGRNAGKQRDYNVCLRKQRHLSRAL